MSYYCEISFKKIKADRVFDFFTEIKRVCSEHVEDIAEDNYVFTPVFKNFDKIKDYLNSLDKNILSSQDSYDTAQSVFQSTRDYAKLNVFTFRYFYLPNEEILGVFSTHACMRDMFDLTHSFQNSTDQDYEFDSWDGIDIFENIAKKWQYASYHELVDAYEEYMCASYDDYSNVNLDDYYRKVFAYNEIWRMISDYLDREECIVYLHLYSYYDCTPINNFMAKCIKCSKEFYNGK